MTSAAACHHVRDVDHDDLFFAVIDSQPHHHLGEDAFIAPSRPTVMVGRVRPYSFGASPITSHCD